LLLLQPWPLKTSFKISRYCLFFYLNSPERYSKTQVLISKNLFLFAESQDKGGYFFLVAAQIFSSKDLELVNSDLCLEGLCVVLNDKNSNIL